jgi:hypothetical protein
MEKTFIIISKAPPAVSENIRRMVEFTEISKSKSRIAENVSEKIEFGARNEKERIKRNMRFRK